MKIFLSVTSPYVIADIHKGLTTKFSFGEIHIKQGDSLEPTEYHEYSFCFWRT